jgi:DNA repair exonuclease SbcCD ATPase subunit
MTASAWTIEKVTVTDVLGFQGTAAFDIGPGMQVIEAPNHSGKTSLTLALLWCLTGEIPKLPRLHLGSFRLTNKHRGDNASPRVAVVLAADGGKRRMVVDRKYSSARKVNLDEVLSVEHEGQTLTGTDAQDTIQAALALKPASLQGCGVVLQHQGDRRRHQRHAGPVYAEPARTRARRAAQGRQGARQEHCRSPRGRRPARPLGGTAKAAGRRARWP